MQIIHLANTDFEFELANSQNISIEQSWNQYPLCLQLQYLPLLYASAQEIIAVTAVPSALFIEHLLSLGLWKQERDLPRFISLNTPHSFSNARCCSWGFSKRVQQWAVSKNLLYPVPDWSVVQEINSKQFSFENSGLEGSHLIWNPEELQAWLSQKQGNRVLKTCFGLSGRGNRLINQHTSIDQLLLFCQQEWQMGRPMIAEPWLDRFFDFSTQWELTAEGKIECIGATVFDANWKGTYQGTWAGPEALLFQNYHPFLQQHKAALYPVLEKIVSKGFFGPLGVDAFLYYDAQQKIQLYPLVEINGRQTMSLAALRFQQRWFPTQVVHLTFMSAASNFLLPLRVPGIKGEQVFQKSLIFNPIFH